MMDDLSFVRVLSPEHPGYGAALALYGVSFPAHEQREAASQSRILGDARYHFELIFDGEEFVGDLLYWDMSNYAYVEHFCILPGKRSRRYGERTLAQLGRAGKPVILEIDPPVDAISVRRRGFYERCGYFENPFPHIHPPYHAGNRGHDLVIMSSPAPISGELYDTFARDLRDVVMKDAFS